MSISLGDRVRSFDFAHSRDIAGERSCYVEGRVVGFVEREGCRRYRILVERDVFGGEESDRRVGTHVTPPVNGLRTTMGNKTNFVELV